MILKIILFGLLIPNVSPKKPQVFCDDVIGRYTAVAGNLALTNLEFPIMSAVPAGSSASADMAVPKLMHPCYSLSVANNYKNQVSEIFDHGDFVASVCERQCAHFVDAFRFECGDRRPPPTWLVGSVVGAKRKINCSNWDLPLTDKGVRDGISLTFTYGTFQSGNGQDLDPPYTLDNQSMAYLDDKFIKGIHIKPIVDPAKKEQAISDMETMLVDFVTRHPEIIHVGFGNPITFFGDAYRNQSKYFAPRFSPSAKFWETLAKVPSLNSLALALIDINGKESIPSNMTRNLKSIGFYNITMTAIPNWVQSDILQFLEFSVTLSDETDMKVLENLPALEHFLLSDSPLTSIKSPFLPKSTKLLSLTLQCNAINSIAAGAFDHFTQLKYLNLAGNRIVSLPENLLLHLDNLLTLDLKTMENMTSLMTYNEVSMQCQAMLKPTFPPPMLDSMPVIPNPENLLALDVRGQQNFLKQNPQFLREFKNLEILNLGNLGLTSILNLTLETLCNLNDLNIVGNPLSDKEWIGEQLFVNLNLQRIRLGVPMTMVGIPNSLIAFMRTASQIMYSTPISLNQVEWFKYKIGCDYDIISTATMFGYKLRNVSCETVVNKAIEKIRSMEMLKMETTCQ